MSPNTYVSINIHYPWGWEEMFTGSGGGGTLGSRDEKRGGGRKAARRKFPGKGALGWAGSRGKRGAHATNLLCGSSSGLAQVAEGGVEDRPLPGAWSTRPSLPTVRTPQAQDLPGTLPGAGSHRVGCGGSVAGPERRQGDGRGWAGPHSASGSPRADPRGSLKLANGGVPSSAWEPRAGGDKRGSGWGKRATQTPLAPVPAPVGSEPPFFSPREKMEGDTQPGKSRQRAGKRGGSGTRLPGAHQPAAKLSSRPGWEQRWAGAPWPTSPGPGEGRASQPRGRSAGAPRSGRPSPNPPGPGLPGAPTRTARAPCRRQGPGALTGRVGGRSGGRRFPG